jgi:hypothetical protein
LAAGQQEDAMVRFEDTVGTRISSWAATQFRDELEDALELFAGSDRDLDDHDGQIFLTWFCSDRELTGGGTPVERYAVRPDLDAREAAVARRIAGARLSLQRVRAMAAGRWIELEDLLSGVVVRVRSRKVSREAARWDVLLCRVVEDDPSSLWGPVMRYAPDEERELIGEVERLAGSLGIAIDVDDGRRVMEVAALELMRFVPPGRCAAPSFFTVEGDPVVNGHARWAVSEVASVLDRLDSPPQLVLVGAAAGHVGDTLQLTIERVRAVARRGSLPREAVFLESSLTALPGRVCVGTFVLTDDSLLFTTMSEARLNGAIEFVEERLGGLATLRERIVTPFEPELSRERDAAPRRREPPPGLTVEMARDLERQLIHDHYSRWIDEPLEMLAGRTPRQAAGGGGARDELEQLLRGIENRAERTRRSGTAWPDLDWLREELGMHGDELAA